MRAQRSLWLALSGLSLVGLVGCDSPAFPADAVFRCQSDADCEPGEVCDTSIGGCVVAEGEGEEGEGEVGEGEGDVVVGEGEGEGGCAVDTDCDAGFTCEGDVCVDLAPSSTAPGVSATSIRIGLSAALTAGPKEEGAAFADGVRAAFAERNAAGGVRHRSVELVALNDGGNPTTATTNATTFTTGAQPAFALMASSSQTVAALEAAATSGSRVLMTGRAGSAAVFDSFNRFSFSTRASGQEEVAQAINFFISDRDLRTPLQNFAVLVEGSSDAVDATATDFADDVAGHVESELQDRVLPPATITLQRLNYRANTLDMDRAVESTLQWIAGGTIRTNETGARPVVVVLAGSGKSVSKYVEDVLNAFHDVKLGAANPAAFGLDDNQAQQLQLVDDILFWAPNETGLDTVTAQTSELGTYDTVAGDVPYCSRIVSTQVVPAASPAGTAAGYVSALNALSQTATPTRAGFEGYVAARVLLEGLKAAPAALTTDALIAALEGLAPVDFGSGGIDYSVSSHVGVPASSFYEGVSFDGDCADTDVDLDVTPQPPPQAQGCPVGVRLNDVDQICVLQGQLLGDAGPIHLTNDFDYLLKGVVFIGDGSAQAQLVIDPGTTIIGDFETTGTLVITRNADIIADAVHQDGGADETCSVKADCATAGAVCVDGLCASPILFTSEKPVGQRATGDWGGIVINGRAPLNCTQNGQFNAAEGTTAVNGSCQGVGEGGSGLFGGNDPDDNSGVMRFVRIEFAGKRIQDGTTGLENELNGIAFQAVGRGTVVDYVHVHRGQDDGVEMFGGTVDLKHIFITCADDDSFDWTGGYQGRAQFVMLQQCGGIGDNGIEADNRGKATGGVAANDFSPRSRPVLANFSVVGLNDAAATGKSKAGALIREGTDVTVANSVFVGFNGDCLDLDDAATFNQAGAFDPSTFAFTPAVDGDGARFVDFPGSIVSCASQFEVEAANAVEIPFGANAVSNVFSSSTGTSSLAFPATSLLTNPFVGVDAGTNSRFTPSVGSALRAGVATFTDPYAATAGAFFETVTYRGAIDPAADWTVGWTSSPAN